jgi:hypothetical protein
MIPKIILCLAFVLSGVFFNCSAAYAEETTANSPASNQMPLILTIEAPERFVKRSGGTSFTVVFLNISTNNLLLNGGQMLGNGSQSWDSLEAELKNEAGQRISMTLHWGVGGVSGRIYFLGIPLRAGSSYSLLVSPNDYYVGAGERIKPGKYEIRFVYHGRQSSCRDSTQMPACWEGEVHSKSLTFDVLAK